MDAVDALAELTAMSSQVETAAIVDEGGVVGATGGNGAALAEAGRELLERAARSRGGREPAQLAVSTARGGVFVVRGERRTIVATTVADASVGLVFHDLKGCLRDAA